MTKLLEEMVARVSKLSDVEQDALAIHMLEGMASVKEDAPVPEWHKKLLDERRAARVAGLSKPISVDEFWAEIERRRAVSC